MTTEKILRWIVLAGLFSMPFVVFVVANSTFFPFVVAKNLVFRTLVEIMFVAWVALAAIEPRWRPKNSKVLIAVASFVGVVALADILGMNPLKSVWSNFERMEGLITLVHLLAYTVVAACMFTQQRVSLWFWRVSLITASIVAVHAGIQFLETGKQRLDSTLGNPIYLAVFALFHIFIALVLFARREAGARERILYSLVLPLQFWVLFMTATRGAILGVIGGLLLAALGILFSFHRNKVAQISAAVLVALIFFGVGIFWGAKDSSFVQGSPVLKRFASISLSEGTVFARTVVWSMAWEGVKERPLLGWGQENFSLVFSKHYDPRMYAQEPWFDRTHNVVLDWLIAAGVLGLLAYISIFLALLWVVYKTKEFNVVQKWFLVGLMAAYSFHNLTVFDQVISYILFFSFVGWIIATAKDVTGRTLWVTRKTFKTHWLLIVLVLSVAMAVVWGINAKTLQTNIALLSSLRDANKAHQLGEAGNKVIANTLSEQALEGLVLIASMQTSGTQEARELISQMASKFASVEWMSEPLRERWFTAGVAGLQAEGERAPLDARFPVFLAKVYASFGELDEEKAALQTALTASPKKQAILIELAANAVNRGEEEEAQEYLKNAYSLEKSYTTAGALYAIRLIVNNNLEVFDEVFVDSVYIGADSRVLSALIDNNHHARALRVWERAFTNSLNPRYAFLLGSIYAKKGDGDKAAESIQRAIDIDPRAQEEGSRILRTL